MYSPLKQSLLPKPFVALALAATAVLAGCRQDMHNQPKFYPQRGTDFYADGRSARPQVDGTVSRSQLHENNYFYTGLENGAEGAGMPFPVTLDVLAKGQEKYNVFCTPCHSRVGNGYGMIVSRGYSKAGNFHTARLQNAPLGHFFSVITNGYGSMPAYASQVTPEERWAITAYVRALQLSQNATQAEVAPGEHVESLGDISEREGLSRAFAADWVLPPTAVDGTPTGNLYVIPPNQIPASTSMSGGAQQPAQVNMAPGANGLPASGPGSSMYGTRQPGSPGPVDSMTPAGGSTPAPNH